MSKLKTLPESKRMEKFDEVLEAGTFLYGVFTSKTVSKADKYLAAAALLYFVSPVDIIPDAVPIAGYLDDGIVMMTAVKKLHTGLKIARPIVRSALSF